MCKKGEKKSTVPFRKTEWVFVNIVDVIAYIIITAFYPVFSFFINESNIKNYQKEQVLPILITLTFFFANYCYDFILKYINVPQDNHMNRFIIHYLLSGAIAFFVFSFVSIVLVFLIIYKELKIDSLKSIWFISQGLAYAACLWLIYPLLELYFRIKNYHWEKIS